MKTLWAFSSPIVNLPVVTSFAAAYLTRDLIASLFGSIDAEKATGSGQRRNDATPKGVPFDAVYSWPT